jgi:hypothetical protein
VAANEMEGVLNGGANIAPESGVIRGVLRGVLLDEADIGTVRESDKVKAHPTVAGMDPEGFGSGESKGRIKLKDTLVDGGPEMDARAAAKDIGGGVESEDMGDSTGILLAPDKEEIETPFTRSCVH